MSCDVCWIKRRKSNSKLDEIFESKTEDVVTKNNKVACVSLSQSRVDSFEANSIGAIVSRVGHEF